MRHILRQHEYVADDWRYFGEDAPDGTGVVVPLAEFRTNRASWLARSGPLGVRIAPGDKVEELAEDLPRLQLIAIEFPSFSDGRGFSQARLLRTRLGYRGELRAVGAVKQDLIFYMARTGITSFELAAGEDVAEATRALQRYTVAYQPADPAVPITRQRYFATRQTG
jgi:uncharacterized protein (DUF934 family)